MRLAQLSPQHYARLADIAMEDGFGLPRHDRIAGLKRMQGFVILTPSGDIAGALLLSDYIPMGNAIVHCVVAPKYQRRWVNRAILREFGNYAFRQLELPRLTSFCFIGLTDNAGLFLEKLGFKHEGTTRKGFRTPNGRYIDVKLYGLLAEECTWIEEVQKCQ